MGRRTVLLIVAVLIAALGSTMVFLYVSAATLIFGAEVNGALAQRRTG